MCGIFGYFDRSRVTAEEPLLAAMGRMLWHRGPDDLGLHCAEGVAIGNRRLSIIDVAGGHQPFISDDGRIAVVQNGEIFNHVELAAELSGGPYACRTHSDTEVLLRLYESEGLDFISRLNGMFAFAIYDAGIDSLFLVRDRIGVKPLYIHDDGNRMYFASEIKSLLAAGVPRRMDHEALHHFLTFNYVPPPRTMFDGIRHLEPGHYLRIDRSGVEDVRWWSLADQRVESRPESEWMVMFNETLDDAVRLRLRSDVPFGAFLSGGVDSTSVVGRMSRHLDEPVNTYAIGFHEARFDESPYAEQAARLFGTRHVAQKVDSNMLDLWPLAIWHCDQPHGDVSFLPTYRVSQLAAREVKVVLTGDGGDELFAGYEKYKKFFASDADGMPGAEFRSAYHGNLTLFGENEKRCLYGTSLRAALHGVDSHAVTAPLFDECAHMDRINQALYLDMQLLLAGNNLVKPDRMGMAVSLEARTPFLDYRMMELAFRIPGGLKLKDGETKYIYKKAVAPLIGEDLAYRRKQMFTVPVGEWFRDRLSGFVDDILLGERTSDRALFDRDVVAGMIAEHRFGQKDRTRELRALIAVELWARLFMDSEVAGLREVPSLDFAALGVASDSRVGGG
ncbi:MAG: asparagine synthase (glutamine-hydrolyzing) [Gammaproteobacteria bacterium]|nr:asparagine synthase (glutamine-hydrolyzing) [Gammaproteobacteria bacterium]MBU0769873.1 asparagine synthase (glutamine-hydrolyzing) [Gammaproteobacteria bacterium]MBU0854678.1 asparagine synthase (glutamine-hydrolyzing) [Gammaproteobacteria bacterium]MBU1845449.1 asparagine synthase (glutamine-hydrolyzing) [Gammaproteobacteria bacterium]